jgi:protein TonB
VCCAPASAADWKSALARPLSPGSVALLVEHKSEPAVREGWAAALKGERPEVRAAAARVIHTSGEALLVADLVTALAKEADITAAVEEVRAIGSLSNANTDGALLAAGRRLGPPVVDVAADVLGRMRGVDALAHLASLRSAGLTSAGYSYLARMSARRGPEGVTQMAQAALRESDPQAWGAALEEARTAGSTIDAALMKSALGMEAPLFRALAYWHLAREVDRGSALLPDVMAALTSTPEAMGTEPGDVDTRFAFEVLQRAQGRAPREVGGWMARRSEGRMPFPSGFPYGEAILERLTAAERKLLNLPDVKDVKPARKRSPRGDADPVIGLTTAFPRGFAADVIAVTGCKPHPRDLAAAVIRYGPEGRPRNISLFESQMTPNCQEASRTLLLSVLAPPGDTSPSAVVVVPMSPEVLACGEDQGAAAGAKRPDQGEAARIGGPIREPKKLVNVPPIYPEAARQARVSGIVILETVLSPSGCMTDMKVLEGIPMLNAAAMSAVAHWRYTPTLLDGRPVPVIMTITVNFRLSQ